jgi:hypothetical protein
MPKTITFAPDTRNRLPTALTPVEWVGFTQFVGGRYNPDYSLMQFVQENPMTRATPRPGSGTFDPLPTCWRWVGRKNGRSGSPVFWVADSRARHTDAVRERSLMHPRRILFERFWGVTLRPRAQMVNLCGFMHCVNPVHWMIPLGGISQGEPRYPEPATSRPDHQVEPEADEQRHARQDQERLRLNLERNLANQGVSLRFT